MAGTSVEMPQRVRRARKPESSRVAAVSDNARSHEPASAADAAALPPGVLTNAVVTETIPAAASVVRLNAGLYAVKIGTAHDEVSGSSSAPVRIWFGSLAGDGGLETLSTAGRGEECLREGETNLAVRMPSDGALVIATAFGSSGQVPSAPSVIAQSLDTAISLIASDAGEPIASPQPAQPPQAEREIRTEITAHIERAGDRVFGGSTWAGTPGAQKRIEGFSIKPLQEIQPSEIEYKALHPGGIETPWVRGPQFCGTRGRSLPLTGLAVRIAPHVQDQFSVIYQAAFFRSGITEPRSNGAPCLPKLPGDSLEGIYIRIVQRRPG